MTDPEISVQILAPRCEPQLFDSREAAMEQAADWAERYDELVDVRFQIDGETVEQITFGRDGGIRSTWKEQR